VKNSKSLAVEVADLVEKGDLSFNAFRRVAENHGLKESEVEQLEEEYVKSCIGS